jgi:SPP1 family predicted phage head-tail adaptor
MPRVVINPKSLRHPIMIQKRVANVTRNSTGEELLDDPANWQDLAPAFADIKPLTGRQLEQARSITDSVSHLLTIRYLEDVQAGQRVKFGDRVFTINSVTNEQEMDVKLLLYCTEGVG